MWGEEGFFKVVCVDMYFWMRDCLLAGLEGLVARGRIGFYRGGCGSKVFGDDKSDRLLTSLESSRTFPLTRALSIQFPSPDTRGRTVLGLGLRRLTDHCVSTVLYCTVSVQYSYCSLTSCSVRYRAHWPDVISQSCHKWPTSMTDPHRIERTFFEAK